MSEEHSPEGNDDVGHNQQLIQTVVKNLLAYEPFFKQLCESVGKYLEQEFEVLVQNYETKMDLIQKDLSEAKLEIEKIKTVLEQTHVMNQNVVPEVSDNNVAKDLNGEDTSIQNTPDYSPSSSTRPKLHLLGMDEPVDTREESEPRIHQDPIYEDVDSGSEYEDATNRSFENEDVSEFHPHDDENKEDNNGTPELQEIPNRNNSPDSSPKYYSVTSNARGDKQIGLNTRITETGSIELDSAKDESEINADSILTPNDEPFYINTDRNGANMLLSNQGEGAFLFRPSRVFFLVLAVKHQDRVYNFGIERNVDNSLMVNTDGTVDLPKFTTINDIVTHFTKRPIMFKAESNFGVIYLKNTALPNLP